MSRHTFPSTSKSSGVFKKVNHKLFKKVFNVPTASATTTSSESDSTVTTTSSLSPSPTKKLSTINSNGTSTIFNSHSTFHKSRFKLSNGSSRLNNKVRLKLPSINFLVSPLKTVHRNGSKYKLSRTKLVRSSSVNNSSISNLVPTVINGHTLSTIPSLPSTSTNLLNKSPFKLSNVASQSSQGSSNAPSTSSTTRTRTTSSQLSSASHTTSTTYDWRLKLVKKAVKSSHQLNKYKDLRKKNKSKRYSVDCIFFVKFGKCKDIDNGCPYNHDPSKVAICTRFLKGKCFNSNCLFSHKTSSAKDASKVPVCKYFLNGNCSIDNCNYNHVNVGSGANICRDFVKFGSCPKFKCSNHHIMICPDFIQYNNCHSTKCHLPHIKLPSAKDGDHVQGRKKQKISRRRSISSSASRNKMKGAQTTTISSNLVNAELVKPKIVNDPNETLDFIPIASSSSYTPPPTSPFNCFNDDSSDSDDDCDLSILPRFIINMINNNCNDDESVSDDENE